MSTVNISELLKALAFHQYAVTGKGSQDQMCDAVFGSSLGKTTIHECLALNRPPLRKSKVFWDSIQNYLASHGTTQGTLLEEYRRENPVASNLPKLLRGLWFVAMYRAKRAASTDENPDPDYRVGILCYGPEEGGNKRWQIIGENTLWEGIVKAEEESLLFVGKESTNNEITESVTILMHSVNSPQQDELAHHHGLALGIGRGPHDREYPIFASRCVFRAFPEQAYHHIAPLDESEIDELRSICGYISEKGRIELIASIGDNPRLAARNDAMVKLRDLGQVSANFADRNRILIRR